MGEWFPGECRGIWVVVSPGGSFPFLTRSTRPASRERKGSGVKGEAKARQGEAGVRSFRRVPGHRGGARRSPPGNEASL
jgi:hypothetical protein